MLDSSGFVSTLHLPPKAMAQVNSSEAAKVLLDDTIEALKSNDTSKAQVHLNILNQQLPTFVNSSSVQSGKLLLDDVTSALKNKKVNSALVHLNLVKQQLTAPPFFAIGYRTTCNYFQLKITLLDKDCN